ncbi:MAG: RNA methyltransferase [Polyangiaceae bacterium]|jgi:putative N6-adenine-specific DNA methylase|nr:RNA methyltransferase [Polyangiaceae bacterium]
MAPPSRPEGSSAPRREREGSLAFFASAAKGTEAALGEELAELGLHQVRKARGGVHFRGPWEDAWCACLLSRIALRVLHPIAAFDAPDGASLYEGVRDADWSPYLGARHTLAVSAVGGNEGLRNTQFVAQKTKDAIVDQIRDREGDRPSVDRVDPDLRVFVRLEGRRATAYVDLAGESLHRRGYREHVGGAPLKETLAAALLRLAGYRGDRPLCDPLCGAGTIVIEAAQIAQGLAPGLLRRRFGFERWAQHDASAAERLRSLRARLAPAPGQGLEPLGSDSDPRALEATRHNASLAGARVRLERRPLASLAPSDPPGLVVTNPPYGQRLDLPPSLVPELRTALRRLAGHRLALLSFGPELESAVGRRPDATHELYNGDLLCKLLVYDLP